MKITQHDVAQVDTVTLQRLAIMYGGMGKGGTARELQPFCSALARSLLGVIRERRSLELMAEAEMMNDDRPGYLVGPDDDPVADALAELRSWPDPESP